MNDLVTGDHQEFFEIPNIIKGLMWIHECTKATEGSSVQNLWSSWKKPRAEPSEKWDYLHWELVFEKALEKDQAN